MSKHNNRLKAAGVNQGPRLRVDTNTGGGSTQTEPIRFSFRYFCEECVDNCTIDELRAFAKRLQKLSGLTWQDLAQSHRHGLGHEKIPRAQLQVRCTLSEDVTEVLSFRYGHGFDPMIGHREGGLLHVLWVSHNHDAYAG